MIITLTAYGCYHFISKCPGEWGGGVGGGGGGEVDTLVTLALARMTRLPHYFILYLPEYFPRA